MAISSPALASAKRAAIESISSAKHQSRHGLARLACNAHVPDTEPHLRQQSPECAHSFALRTHESTCLQVRRQHDLPGPDSSTTLSTLSARFLPATSFSAAHHGVHSGPARSCSRQGPSLAPFKIKTCLRIIDLIKFKKDINGTICAHNGNKSTQ